MRSDLRTVVPSGRESWWNSGAAAVGGKTVIHDHVAVALDEAFTALRTARVLPLANRSGQIAGINIAKARLPTDLDSSQQVFLSRVTGLGHLVIAMKSGHVPGNVGRDVRQEFG